MRARWGNRRRRVKGGILQQYGTGRFRRHTGGQYCSKDFDALRVGAIGRHLLDDDTLAKAERVSRRIGGLPQINGRGVNDEIAHPEPESRTQEHE